MPNADYTPIVHHISRLEGQLASIKRELLSDAPDCVKTSTTLRAASRSFSSLKHAIVGCFLEKQFLTPAQRRTAATSPAYQALLDLLRS